MKKYAFFVLLGIMLLPLQAYGQNVFRGDIFVGGDFSATLNRRVRTNSPSDAGDFTEEVNSARINAYAGYFIANGIEIGPDIILDYVERSSDSGGDETERGLSLGGHIGYYHYMNGRWVPFAKLVATFDAFTMTYDTGETRASGFSILPIVGIDYFLTASVALKASAYFEYSSSWWEDDSGGILVDGTSDETNTGLALGFELFL